jgi:Fic-DOC domain mobile mystery protein B
VTALLWDDADGGATPLDEDAKEGLRQAWITTRAELNQAESANIAKGTPRRAPTVDVLLDDAYLRRLHKRLFGDVWTWAGTPRRYGINIGGVDPPEISAELRKLVLEAQGWVVHAAYPVDGVLARFHHRLVWIHPWPNGNGRFARVAADLLARALDVPPFTWGIGLDLDTARLRRAYTAALQAADRDFNDVDALVEFARS